MLQFFILLALALLYFAWNYMQKFAKKNDPIYAEKLEQANQRIGLLMKETDNLNNDLAKIETDHAKLQESFEKLRFNKISADVKLGQKTENLLPFLSEFPYASEDIRGLFNPIDLIAFTDTEVIFIEVKTGAAQLSDKQRKIRDNIKAGRVRFETHRLNEKGVTVK